MGFKSVELQVAIPRTVEASNIQQQMTSQHQRFQESLAQHQLKEQLRKRKQVNEYADTERIKRLKDDQSTHDQPNKGEESSMDQEQTKRLDHPYLGNQFDIMR